jgi:hypothetical protein
MVQMNLYQSKDLKLVRFDVFTAVTMKDAIFWNVAPKRRLTQDLHGATSQMTAFFKLELVYV